MPLNEQPSTRILCVNTFCEFGSRQLLGSEEIVGAAVGITIDEHDEMSKTESS
jgi:hypothetical protein